MEGEPPLGPGVVVTNVLTGELVRQWTGAAASSCKQELAVLADVASARNFGKNEYLKVRAAYVGDTWGNLWRHDDAGLERRQVGRDVRQLGHGARGSSAVPTRSVYVQDRERTGSMLDR